MEIFSVQDLFTSANLVALLTLTLLEVVLGIDNVVFISILAGKLPEEQRKKARMIGLSLALGSRLLLLLAIKWVMTLTVPLTTVWGLELSGKSLILLVGGLFLIGKATFEIHEKMELGNPDLKETQAQKITSLTSALIQIVILDVIFSLDSVITAVGMAQDIRIMVIAILIAVAVMMIFAGAVSDFIENHPTIKILALSFLLLIGVMLLAEGVGQHINKGFIYFAMGFSLVVELLNLRIIKIKHKAKA